MPNTFQKLPAPFNNYRLTVNSDHLHFGLWPVEKQDFTLEEAQQCMFDKLISHLPAPPSRVLNVGCGLGLSARMLALRGYEVTAISPSPELIEYARQKHADSGTDFRVLDFSSNDPVFSENSFDVLFFQESIQQLSSIDKVIKKARYLLKDRALIVICDEVCYDSSIKSETSVHMAKDFTIALSENGFRIMENHKLGERVAPTCNFVIEGLTKNFAKLESTSNDPDTKKALPLLLNRWKKQKIWYSNKQMGYEIFTAKKDSFFIRQYNAGDEKQILSMFKEAFNADRSLEHWNWKYRDNPYGSHKISLGFSEEGNMVSHFAGYPVRFCFTVEDQDKPKTFTAIHGGDTMTHKSVRRIGLGKTGLLARTTFHFYARFCEGHVPFGYGFNTENIKKLGERYLEYKYIDPVMLWVKDIIRNPVKPPGFVFRLFSGFSVEEVHSVNDEWDNFFDSVCPSYKFLAKRDSTYIRWRYINCPDKGHRVFAVRKRGRLTGWGVFKRKENRLIWGDALFDKKYPESVSYLLYSLLSEYFPETGTIEGWFSLNPEWWSTRLKSIGFEKKNEPNHITPCFHILTNKIFEEQSVMEKINSILYYTEGDSDLF